MDYIVFDLEWNQNPNERARPNRLLPFEIIEIGAVRLNENREIVDTFHRLIRPSVYHWIQDSIHQVIHVNYRDLRKGTPFPDAADDFIRWCGHEYRFCTWAKQDVMELQRNMRYYHMLDLLPGPVVYYDVQKLYSLSFEDGRARRSLEHVVNSLQLKRDKSFHRALADAMYTGQILQQIDIRYLTGYESVDAWQNPREKGEEFLLRSGEREKFISREFSNRERVLWDPQVYEIHCPVCLGDTQPDPALHKGKAGKADWFMNNSKICYSLTRCPEHGLVAGRIRVRKTETNRYFAVKTLRLASEQDAQELRAKREALLEKKRKKMDQPE